jgi:hypothetical protein
VYPNKIAVNLFGLLSGYINIKTTNALFCRINRIECVNEEFPLFHTKEALERLKSEMYIILSFKK